MDFRKEEITCITCKHFPCFPADKAAKHTGHFSIDYSIVYDRRFPCEKHDIGVKWEPNQLLAEFQKKRKTTESMFAVF